jgi:hypothetical protein
MPKEPDPLVWRDESARVSSLSVASTTVTMFSPFKASYTDLTSLVEPEPVSLPRGALLDSPSIQEDNFSPEGGSRHGKYVSRGLSRECSWDGDNSDLEPERAELFCRLLKEADRLSCNTGCHVKVTKLTTSKTCPYKTFLRHTSD